MELTQKQSDIKSKIELISQYFGLDPSWPLAIAMVESSLGLFQKSPTNCLGVFQMSSIAMKDLLQSMGALDDDLVDIVCGIAFLRLLLRRHKTVELATEHFCDPADRPTYIPKVMNYISSFKK